MRRFFLVLVAVVSYSLHPAQAEDPLVFISSFAPKGQGAIVAYRLDSSGALKEAQRTTDAEHSFFLALSKSGKFLYSIHARTFGGKDPEEVAAYAIDRGTGGLKLLNRKSSHGTASCYLDVHPTGRAVLVANYSTGNVASLPIDPLTGSLSDGATVIQHTGSSVNPARQKEPHAHCFAISPDGRFGLAADLGLDQVLVYRLGADGAGLAPHVPPYAKSPPGAGPRHLTFEPSGKRVYVINELLNSVTVFDYAADAGTLTERQTISTLPEDFQGTSHCADLKITPDGRFLYGTNRGHDSIAAYRIGSDGLLTRIGIEPSRGKGPQNLLIAGDGKLLLCANMPGNNIAVFRIDPDTGKLTLTGEPVSITSPSCIRLLP